jgi:small subunit ribosomal protein S19
MSRSLKKGPYVDENLIKKIQKLKKGDQTVIKTWARRSVVSPEMVGFRIGIHNGREHIPVLIVEDMVGHKLGEFAPTRKFIKHGGRMAREEAQAEAKKAAQSVQAAQEPPKKSQPAAQKE